MSNLTCKISLLGNTVVDNILCVGSLTTGTCNTVISERVSVGAIGNVARGLRKLSNCEIDIHTSVGDDQYGNLSLEYFSSIGLSTGSVKTFLNSSTSHAIIISDIKNCQKTGFIKWGTCRNKCPSPDINSDWIHIQYGDTLDYLDLEYVQKLRTKNNIISLDLCNECPTPETKRRIINLLPEIDYLIISDSECRGFFEDDITRSSIQAGSICRNLAIIHSPEESVASDGGTVKLARNSWYINQGLNVLGAGDLFVACLILNLIEDKEITQSLIESHKFASENIFQK